MEDQEEKEFEKYLERIEDPKNNEEVNYDLPENPTSLQVAKYKLCKKMLAYQLDTNLTIKYFLSFFLLLFIKTNYRDNC